MTICDELRVQLDAANQERAALLRQLDAVKGASAKYREAIKTCHRYSSKALDLVTCNTDWDSKIYQLTGEVLQNGLGKAVSVWQSEALEEVAELIRRTTTESRNASDRECGIVQGHHEIIDLLYAEASRLRTEGVNVKDDLRPPKKPGVEAPQAEAGGPVNMAAREILSPEEEEDLRQDRRRLEWTFTHKFKEKMLALQWELDPRRMRELLDIVIKNTK